MKMIDIKDIKKRIDIKDINVKVDAHADASRIIFETKDGVPVSFIETREFEGYFVTKNDAANMANADALPIMCDFLDYLLNGYENDEPNWKWEANEYLKYFRMALGKFRYDQNGARCYDLIDLAVF